MTISWMLLLCAVAGGLFVGAWGGAGLSELSPVPDPGHCTPQTNSSAPVGVRGYRRYFANDSLIGRPVPCTRDDKTCFRHNLIFDRSLDRCEHIGSYCDLKPNRAEFERGGRLVGVCTIYQDPCPGSRMAYDGRCYRQKVVRDVICGCGSNLTRHFLDGVECRNSPATPIRIQQPEDEGRCLIPDLRFPDIARSQFLQDPFYDIIRRTRTQMDIPFGSFKCNSTQATCFAKRKVRVSGIDSRECHTLLEQGPCPDDYIVALNIQSAIRGRAEATCVHVRGGCPRGYKRMLFDGQCHDDREIVIEVPGRIEWNEYGQNIVVQRDVIRKFTPEKLNELCSLKHSGIKGGMSYRASSPPCRANNRNLCSLYEVETEPPLPEL